MAVLENYVRLLEKDSKLVLSAWKAFQIIFYTVIFFSGIATSYCVSGITESFAGNCFLFSNVTFVHNGNTQNESRKLHLPIDAEKTLWGKDSTCEFCQYVPVAAVIFSLVWATLFMMCGKGGKAVSGLPQPWRIVFPAFVFNVIYFVISLVATIHLVNGIDTFCLNFIENNGVAHCSVLTKIDLAGRSGQLTYDLMVFSKVSAWINTVCWLLGTCLLLLRCFCIADFELVEITVSTYEPTRISISSGSRPSLEALGETSESDAP
ncbi:uncharacterized protein LOC124790186 [Schistocerca piceifrons]|uniref:uncharacterized protein LOC124790186 n=1 Tax=Schistocerca piceifrons TaxID=274613 RepID=UPI001F5F4969|nr:uncharacterized protein LOC124790186 [Schistocerca piceifrons]